jgi:hypothetical protein
VLLFRAIDDVAFYAQSTKFGFEAVIRYFILGESQSYIYTEISSPCLRLHPVQFFCRKIPFRAGKTRKANIRSRLKLVEHNLQVLNETGIECKALDRANLVPTYSMMTPKQRYFYFNRNTQTFKPVHLHPHYTKAPTPHIVPAGCEKAPIR